MTDIARLGLSIDSGDANQAAAALDRFSASAKRAEGAATGLPPQMQKATSQARQMSDQMREADRILDRAGHGFGSLARSVVGIINPAYLAAGALAGIGTAAAGAVVRTLNASAEIEAGLSGIARASGVAAEDVRRLAVAQAEASRLTTGEARSMAIELARTGRVGTEMIEQALTVSRDFAKTIGKELPEANAVLAKALADPAKGVDELNRRLAVFDDRTSQHIKSLGLQNHVLEAQRLIMDGVRRGVVDATSITWGWERAWHATTATLSRYLDKLGEAVELEMGGGSTEQRLRRAEQYLSDNRNLPAWMRWLDSNKLEEAARQARELSKALESEKAARFAANMNLESERFGNLVRSLDPSLAKLKSMQDQIVYLNSQLGNSNVVSRLSVETEAAARRVLDTLSTQVRFHKTGLEIAQEEHSFFMQSTTARTAAQRAEIVYQETVNRLRREGNVDAERLAMMAAERVTIAANEQEKRALEERNFRQAQTIEQMKLEAELVGKSTVQAAALRAEWEYIAEAKRRAFERGETLSPGQLERARSEASGFGASVGAGTALIEGRGLEQQFLTPSEQFAQEVARLDELRAADAIGWQSYHAAKAQAEYQAWQATEQVLANERAMREQTVNLAVGLLNQFAGKSKAAAIAAIALNRGVQIANTIMNTAAASAAALAPPPLGLGPVAGAALAARTQLFGAAQVALIAGTGIAEASMAGRSSTPSSGGSYGGGGGGSYASSSPVRPRRERAPQQTIVIQATGSRYSREELRQIIEGINETVRDGTTIEFR